MPSSRDSYKARAHAGQARRADRDPAGVARYSDCLVATAPARRNVARCMLSRVVPFLRQALRSFQGPEWMKSSPPPRAICGSKEEARNASSALGDQGPSNQNACLVFSRSEYGRRILPSTPNPRIPFGDLRANHASLVSHTRYLGNEQDR